MMVAARGIQKSTKTVQKLLIGRNVIMLQDNDPKHTANTTKDFIREKRGKVLDWPSQSPVLNPIEHAFHFLKRRLKGTNAWNKQQQQQLKGTAVKARKSIKKEERNSLVNGLQDWCSYCKQGICYKTLLFTF